MTRLPMQCRCKKPYASFKAANIATFFYLRCNGTRLKAYRCIFCPFWHLTTVKA